MHFSNSILKLKRVLVALSGGPDSQALLHAFLKTGIEVGIAHVDHGWREESQEEARRLKEQAAELNIPFYLKELNPQEITGNLEQGCRERRYAFFDEVCRREGYEAVALGHHKEDLAETIFKRFLEGASLQAVSGMEEESYWGALLVIRPFLEVSKNTLVAFCKQEGIPYFSDRTNEDCRFLRARMRKEIVPALSAQFGKSIREPLLRFGKECKELNAFMRARFKGIFNQNYLDCTGIESPFEIRWVLREWFRSLELPVSYAAIDTMVHAVISRGANKQFPLHSHLIELDRGRLFIRKKKEDRWSVRFESALHHEVLGWKAAWNGRLEMLLPEGDFVLTDYPDLESADKKIVQKLWTKEKIPAFFRSWVPMMTKEGRYYRDFLTVSGKNQVRNPAKKVILYLE